MNHIDNNLNKNIQQHWGQYLFQYYYIQIFWIVVDQILTFTFSPSTITTTTTTTTNNNNNLLCIYFFS